MKRTQRTVTLTVVGLASLWLAACSTQTTGDAARDPFLAYVQAFGIPSSTSTDTGTATAGTGTTTDGTLSAATFRRNITLTLTNAHATAEVRTRFIAWVELGSVRSGQEQDALLADGYVQTARPLEIGSAFTLPVGTFIYSGDRTPFPREIALGRAGSTAGTAGNDPTAEFEFITPDAILIYSQPPVSCDSVAFEFIENGSVPLGPATSGGGRKTLAQVNVYQCDPLRPGLFYRATGGAIQANEFQEGASIAFTFSPAPTGTAFATVTIGR